MSKAEEDCLTIAADALLTPTEEAGSWLGALQEAALETRGSCWALSAELMPLGVRDSVSTVPVFSRESAVARRRSHKLASARDLSLL